MKKNIKRVIIIILVIVVLAFSTFSSRLKLEFHQRHKVKHNKHKQAKMRHVNMDELNKQIIKYKLFTRELIQKKAKQEAKKMKLKQEKLKEQAREEERKREEARKKEDAKPYTEVVAEITAYTSSGGVGSGLITANGEHVNASRTLAAPPNIPFGTVIEIPGVGKRVVCDRGSAIQGNVFDLYVNSEEEAVQFGRQIKTIKIYKN